MFFFLLVKTIQDKIEKLQNYSKIVLIEIKISKKAFYNRKKVQLPHFSIFNRITRKRSKISIPKLEKDRDRDRDRYKDRHREYTL